MAAGFLSTLPDDSTVVLVSSALFEAFSFDSTIPSPSSISIATCSCPLKRFTGLFGLCWALDSELLSLGGSANLSSSSRVGEHVGLCEAKASGAARWACHDAVEFVLVAERGISSGKWAVRCDFVVGFVCPEKRMATDNPFGFFNIVLRRGVVVIGVRSVGLTAWWRVLESAILDFLDGGD
eukprot:scaffold249310_cov109-Cyclotella_meneghiniana.AAC.2